MPVPLYVGADQIRYIPGAGGVPGLVYDVQRGKHVPHPLKRYVKPYMLATDPATVTVTANTVSDPIPLVIDGKGHFEVLYSMAEATDFNFTVALFDPEHRPLLMNREIHARTICSGFATATALETFTTAGAAGRPFIWPEPWFLNVEKHGRALFATFRDLSGSNNTIRFSLHGRRYYHVGAPAGVQREIERLYKQRVSMPYFYTTDREVILAASTTTDFNMRISDDAYFECWKKMAFTDQTVASQPNNASFNVQIFERQDDRPLIAGRMTRPQAASAFSTRGDLYFGDAEFPYLADEADLYDPNTLLKFTLANQVASENRVHLTYAGRKVFVPSPEEVYDMVYR